MRLYTIIHPLFLSFFSRSLYQDVARNWRGLCLTYLMSLLALCAIPGIMKFQSEVTEYMTNEAPKIARQVPVITIAKGKISIDKPEPYIISSEKTGAPLVIIDTSGKTTSLQGSKAIVLINRSEILVKKDDSETRRFDLSGVDDMVIDRSVIYNWIDAVEEYAAVMVYPFAVLFSFLFHLTEVLLLAAIGNIFAKRAKISLNYKTLVRLAAISITPSLIIGTLLTVVDINVPYWWFMGLWISFGYLLFAVGVNKETTGPVVV